MHLEGFEKESKEFVLELERIHLHIASEVNELNVIRKNVKYAAEEEKNAEYFQKAVVEINKTISILIDKIPTLLTNLKKLEQFDSVKDRIDIKLKGELDVELSQVENLLSTINNFSGGLANLIRTKVSVLEQEIKWIEKENDMYTKIKHNINSWLL